MIWPITRLSVAPIDVILCLFFPSTSISLYSFHYPPHLSPPLLLKPKANPHLLITMAGERSKDVAEGSSSATPSRYESQKRRDWNTFGQYLKNQRPPVPLSHCHGSHVLDFLRYLDQFGKTKVHVQGCVFYGQPDPPAPCTCPLRQAWGSLDALIGRLRAAYEENGGSSETNPFASGAIRVYLKDVREFQAKARGIPHKKKKKKAINQSRENHESSSAVHSS